MIIYYILYKLKNFLMSNLIFLLSCSNKGVIFFYFDFMNQLYSYGRSTNGDATEKQIYYNY